MKGSAEVVQAMRVQSWAQQRLAASEPNLGVAGPVLWSLAIVLVGIAAWLPANMNDSEFAAASLVALAAVVGLATSPIWMLRVAARRHHRRNAAQRDDARSLRQQLDEAFVERRLAEDRFQRLDDELDAVRRGETPGDLAAASGHYLRAVAWTYVVAAVTVALAAAVGAAWITDAPGNDINDPIVQTTISVGVVAFGIGIGVGIVFGAAAARAAALGRRYASQERERLREVRRMLLDMRRT